MIKSSATAYLCQKQPMLLLLGVPRYPLSEAFEFSQGSILQPRNRADNAGKDNLCRVIYSGDFSTCDKEIDIDKLPLVSLSKPIKATKILRKEDYLISAKGGIKSFSLYQSLKNRREGSLPIAASNNLIVVRPKPEAIESNGILYMHNLLDLVIHHIRMQDDKPEATESKNQVVTIKSLSELKIHMLAMQQVMGYQAKFSDIIKRWEATYDQLREIQKELDSLNAEIKAEILKEYPHEITGE